MVVLYAVGVSGFNAEIHRMVAGVAAHFINGETVKYVESHLPKPDGIHLPHADAALIDVASWADRVKLDPGYAWSRDLHFVGTPYRACAAYDEARDCDRGRCVVTAIANYTQRASDTHLSREARGEALKFLVHFVADAHSGMHVSFVKDLGGNKINLRSPQMSLHEVWDSQLLTEFFMQQGSPQLRNGRGVTLHLVSRLVADPKMLQSSLLRTDSALHFAAAIASETARHVTCDLAYKDDGVWIQSGATLSARYLATRSRRLMDIIARAGARLAQLLDSVAEKYHSRLAAARPARQVPRMVDSEGWEQVQVQRGRVPIAA